jgi:ABC-type multidrug transport system fused ATPase/permease subunit
MGRGRAMSDFWRTVCVKAFWDAFVLFYDKPILLLVALVGMAVAAFLAFIFRSKAAFVEHIKSNVLIVAFGGIVTFLGFFAYFMLRAPSDMFSEMNVQLRHSQERERTAVQARKGAELQLGQEHDSWEAFKKQQAEQRPRVLSKEPLKLQLFNYPQIPKNKRGAYATDFVVIANQRLEAPINLLFRCNGGGKIAFAVAMVGNDVTFISGWRQEQDVFAIRINNSVPAYVPIVTTIESTTETTANMVSLVRGD